MPPRAIRQMTRAYWTSRGLLEPTKNNYKDKKKKIRENKFTSASLSFAYGQIFSGGRRNGWASPREDNGNIPKTPGSPTKSNFLEKFAPLGRDVNCNARWYTQVHCFNRDAPHSSQKHCCPALH